jgi:DNA-binding NarL/FixJ family response regulator
MRSRASFIAAARPGPRRWGYVPVRCLIVDDNPEFLASASRLLKTQGLQIVGRAASGEEAVRLADALAPDVALVDVQLGDEDGIEVARKLAGGPQPTPVVLISTHSQDELADLIADSPAVGFLSKTELSAGAVVALIA